MKKIFALGLTIILILSTLLAGCGNNAVSEVEEQPVEKKSIVCTIFPVYDWINNVIGENSNRFEVTLLGVDSDFHSYQPSAEDIAKIQTCDLFVMVGGESEQWAAKAVKGTSVETINIFEELSLLAAKTPEEETTEGTTDAEPAEGETEEKTSEAEKETVEAKEKNEEELIPMLIGQEDEHIWLSLNVAKRAVDIIGDKLCEIDPYGKRIYTANTVAYRKTLSVLNINYSILAERSKDKTLIVADRFPFAYLMNDHGVKYHAAFKGCTADTDANFEVIASLAEKVDELGKTAIIVLEDSSQDIARTVIENTESKNAQIVVMNSLQSVTSQDIKDGITYADVMNENMVSFRKALQ